MRPRTVLAPMLLLFGLVSCDSEDPRLPQSLYDEAVELNQQGKTLEAKSMMEMISQRYPGTPAGSQAQKDIYLMDALIKQDIQERQKQLRVNMRRVADALARYHERHGQYPNVLQDLVPDYLEKTPETAWGHPFFYRPYVKVPIEDIRGRRGAVSQRINTAYDGYQLVCLGVDLRPGGEDMAGDLAIVDGDWFKEKNLPPIPLPQPVK